MSEITRYVLVNHEGHEEDYEYTEFEFERVKHNACERGCAVVARTYAYADSELVWTPDGSDTWPPEKENHP